MQTTETQFTSQEDEKKKPSIFSLWEKLFPFSDKLDPHGMPDEVEGVGIPGDSMVPSVRGDEFVEFGADNNKMRDTYGYSGAYSRMLDRMARYFEYQKLDGPFCPECSTSLDNYADDASQQDEEGHTFRITCSNDSVRNELEFLFFRILDIDSKMWSIARSLCKNGDFFTELVIDKGNAALGILKAQQLPCWTMWRIETTKGKLLEFQQGNAPDYEVVKEGIDKKNKNNQDNNNDNNKFSLLPQASSTLGPTRAGNIRFTPKQIIHFKIGEGRRGFLPYGVSILEPARALAYQLKLMEDAMLVYRLTRSPERRIFYIDVGMLPPNKADAFVERVRDKLKKKKVYTPGNQSVTERFNPMCLPGDQKIPLLDGRMPTLLEIIKEFNTAVNKNMWTYSVNKKTKTVEPGKIVWAGKTRKNATLVEVTLDNGKKVKCTPDHKFITKTGDEVRAQDLQPGTSLMSIVRTQESCRSSKCNYEFVQHPSGKKELTHIIVVPTAPAGHVRHHKDHNPLNNNPDNFQIMHWHEHGEHHKHSPIAKAKIGKATTARCNGPNSDNYREVNRQCVIAYNSSPQHELYNAIRSKTLTETWANPKKRASIVSKCAITFPRIEVEKVVKANPTFGLCKITNVLNSKPKLAKLTREINSDYRGEFTEFKPDTIKNWVKREGFSSWSDFKSSIIGNHKVVSVKFLEEREDTYCITVEKSHNFLIEQGVTIKNSVDEDFWLPTRPNSQTRVDTLPGATNLGEIDDAVYFREKLYKALGIPKSKWAGTADGTLTRMSLSAQDVDFARRVDRIQKTISQGIKEIARRHLELIGVPEEDCEDLQIMLTPASDWKELTRQEITQSRTTNAGAMAAFYSRFDILTKIFKHTDDEAEEIIKRKNMDDVDIGKVQALVAALQAQAAVEEPRPAEGAAEGAAEGETELGAETPEETPPEEELALPLPPEGLEEPSEEELNKAGLEDITNFGFEDEEKEELDTSFEEQ